MFLSLIALLTSFITQAQKVEYTTFIYTSDDLAEEIAKKVLKQNHADILLTSTMPARMPQMALHPAMYHHLLTWVSMPSAHSSLVTHATNRNGQRW